MDPTSISPEEDYGNATDQINAELQGTITNGAGYDLQK